MRARGSIYSRPLFNIYAADRRTLFYASADAFVCEIDFIDLVVCFCQIMTHSDSDFGCTPLHRFGINFGAQ